MNLKKSIDIQGHRGARGLYPENTLTAFIEAVKLGVHTLEMDVVISADQQVVVSHEPWMNEAFCAQPDGKAVEKNAREKYNLYKMTYAEIAAFDCGKMGNPKFPQQKKMPAHKPLLHEVITRVETFLKENKLPLITYNIEIKSDPADDLVFQPDPATFVRLLYTELKKHTCMDRIYLQSFDVRILQEIKITDPKMRMALLVENREGLQKNLNNLGFKPEMYSPYFQLVNEDLIEQLKQMNIKLIPWTVNEISDMKRLLTLGVDGIITDYPDRLIALLKTDASA
ncbi:MAG: glycerophosphodiester phosphodiesterase [Bacteroidetes bacterium]|nr:glycerophosphodiester phosphodiesterase [Bacteroidota bacterium]